MVILENHTLYWQVGFSKAFDVTKRFFFVTLLSFWRTKFVEQLEVFNVIAQFAKSRKPVEIALCFVGASEN